MGWSFLYLSKIPFIVFPLTNREKKKSKIKLTIPSTHRYPWNEPKHPAFFPKRDPNFTAHVFLYTYLLRDLGALFTTGAWNKISKVNAYWSMKPAASPTSATNTRHTFLVNFNRVGVGNFDFIIRMKERVRDKHPLVIWKFPSHVGQNKK